jgi:hypothetical protein
LIHSYSLSGEPSAECYRASIKREAFGAAGANIDEKLQVGDANDSSAAREISRFDFMLLNPLANTPAVPGAVDQASGYLRKVFADR